MEKLIEKLTNPFSELNQNNPNDLIFFQNTCSNIARDLFNKYCIKCGNRTFYFAEVEFYYFDQTRFNKDWNNVTYERKEAAGKLFYHLSGVDICFKSDLKKDKNKQKIGYGGGILIRSLWEKTGNDKRIVTVGPLTCVNKILNACKGDNMPKFEPLLLSKRQDIKPKETYRFLGETDFKAISENKNKDGDLKLAYYDCTIIPAEWNNARSSYYSKRFPSKN